MRIQPFQMPDHAPIYVSTRQDAAIKRIGITGITRRGDSSNPEWCYPNGLAVSYDGATFHAVRFTVQASAGYNFTGTITHPMLDLCNEPLELHGGVMTLKGLIYTLDETAPRGEVVTSPAPEALELIEASVGLYVRSVDTITGWQYDYLNGQPLGPGLCTMYAMTSFTAFRYRDHEYRSAGYEDQPTPTFDGKSATVLKLEDHEITFADDLSTVTVTKK